MDYRGGDLLVEEVWRMEVWYFGQIPITLHLLRMIQ